MCYQPKLLKLIAEVDQQLAEVEDGFAGAPPTDPQPKLRSEIVDVLRVALDDFEWLSAQPRIELVSKTRHRTDQPLSVSVPVGSDVIDDSVVVNEFIAAPDAEFVLDSVLKEFEAT
jgi:hypothetical protein